MIRWLKRLALLATALLLALALSAWWLLRGSLPALDGEIALPGLSAPVSIQRDALGVATIDAANEADAMRAMGYLHAQERYFEMDLLRRTSAGELSELFGAVALDLDKRHRVHRMRARVDAQLHTIASDKQPALDAYVAGVNAGLAGLRVRPWPYLLLRQQPRPWTAADSALAGYAMYFDLQDASNAQELALWRIKPHLPPALFALIARDGSQWDAPLFGVARGDAVLPTIDEVDLRTLPMPDPGTALDDASGVGRDSEGTAALTPPSAWQTPPLSPTPREKGAGGSSVATDVKAGSNNFAVSGALTADGRAIVADDMHLGLRAPNLWFRARLRYADPAAPDGSVDLQGFTLPGLPAVIVGSSGRVAWGFTNSYGDYLDWRQETPCAGDTAATGAATCAPVRRHLESILVAGSPPVAFEVRETSWGPILHDLPEGKALSLRWVAQLSGAINFGLSGFARARDLEHALQIADHAATPTQNMVIGDRQGRIAWRLLGPLPTRGPGCSTHDLVDAPGPASGTQAAMPLPAEAPLRTDAGPSTDATCQPWAISTAASPTLRSPDIDRLWTANARVVDGALLDRIGDGGYALGARARQIRDDLQARQQFNERDLLAIQLDDRAELLSRWWELLQARSAASGGTALSTLAAAGADWNGHASVDSVGYRLVRAWRLAVNARISDGLLAPARAALGDAVRLPELQQLEGIAWPLVTQRPEHLLPRRFDSWDALLEDAATEVRDQLSASGPLSQRTWGEHNTAAICHPLAAAVPLVGKRWLCMPADPLPGDGMMARVQGPAFGASQRMVVSPGHEADGIIHMPGGQSGHPLSPFWGAGHADWVAGHATPFLPGAARNRLTLRPAQ